MRPQIASYQGSNYAGEGTYHFAVASNFQGIAVNSILSVFFRTWSLGIAIK